MDFETIFSNCFFSLSHNLVERHTSTLPKQKEKERVVLFFSLAALLCLLLRDVVACVVARACVVHKRLCCVLYVQEMTHSFSTQQKTKTDNTNPKLHPYMFRVFVYDFEKTPFFFLFRLMSIPSLFLSLSLSKKLTRSSWCFHNTLSVPGFVRRREKDIYTHTHLFFSSVFFFTFSLFVRVCAVYLRFDSIHLERETLV